MFARLIISRNGKRTWQIALYPRNRNGRLDISTFKNRGQIKYRIESGEKYKIIRTEREQRVNDRRRTIGTEHARIKFIVLYIFFFFLSTRYR